jgi:hypothetical protein
MRGQVLDAMSTIDLDEGATTVRTRNGTASATDDPRAEAKTQPGGVFLINARDPDDAIQGASRAPSEGLGSVRLWPIRALKEP